MNIGNVKNKKVFRAQMGRLFREIGKISVNMGELNYNPVLRDKQLPLASIIDIHPSNILVKTENDSITD